jgi:hypothetical protein
MPISLDPALRIPLSVANLFISSTLQPTVITPSIIASVEGWAFSLRMQSSIAWAISRFLGYAKPWLITELSRATTAFLESKAFLALVATFMRVFLFDHA